MGRPRKPIADHMAEGTYRPDRHGPRSVAASSRPVSRPRMPVDLSARERAAWRTIVDGLEQAGTLERIDGPLIEGAAVMWARAREARTLIGRHGLLVAGARGAFVANPAVRVERDSWRLFQRLAADVGLPRAVRERLESGAELDPAGGIGLSPRLRPIDGGRS